MKGFEAGGIRLTSNVDPSCRMLYHGKERESAGLDWSFIVLTPFSPLNSIRKAKIVEGVSRMHYVIVISNYWRCVNTSFPILRGVEAEWVFIRRLASS